MDAAATACKHGGGSREKVCSESFFFNWHLKFQKSAVTAALFELFKVSLTEGSESPSSDQQWSQDDY